MLCVYDCCAVSANFSFEVLLYVLSFGQHSFPILFWNDCKEKRFSAKFDALDFFDL